MTKEVIPGSRNKDYAAQQELVAQKPGYEVATLLPAIVCIQTEYVKTGVILYDRNRRPTAYLRTPEQSVGYHVIAGFFGPSGLFVNYFTHDCINIGVAAALRKI